MKETKLEKISFSSYIKLILIGALGSGIISGIIACFGALFNLFSTYFYVYLNIGTKEPGVLSGIINLIIFPLFFIVIFLIFSIILYLGFILIMKFKKSLTIKIKISE